MELKPHRGILVGFAMFAIAIGGYSIYAAVGASIPPLSSEITRARAAPLPVAKTVDS